MNSSIEGKPSFVELTTFWGVRKTGNTISIGQKSCSHDQSEGARAFCTYLSRHSSTEFPEMNFRRILNCLQGKDPFESNVQVHLQDIRVDIDEGAFLQKDLSARLDLKRKNDEVVMRIEVKRWPAEKD